MTGLSRLGALIDAFAPADGAPPQKLWPFFRWAIDGAWTMLGLAAVMSAIAGMMEVVSALILGWVIDAALAGDPAVYFSQNAALLVACLGFYLVLRPLAFGGSSATNSIIIGSNVLPLVLSRLHRWTLGQAVTFFDNDFAGRLATKQMQAARAITDVVTEIINTGFFALASVIASIVYLVTIDWRMAAALSVWLVGYVVLIRHFLPLVRENSAVRASSRAMVTGQVVDTITNIKTVKLFAHADFEDRVALEAMDVFRSRSVEYGVISTLFRLALMALAGLLPVILIGGTLVLWQRGLATAGDIAAAGAISMRIAQMSGWVSLSFLSIYSSVGEVEDGMRTLARAYSLEDAPDAATLSGVKGRIELRGARFAYGRERGGIADVTLTIGPGQRVGIVGASGAGKSTLVSLILRLYDVEDGAVLIDGQDVRSVTQESLRRNIGMVTQDTAMFNRSARDNIRYGRPDASEDELIAASKAAEAHDFILPMLDHQGRKGYDAFLGERGVKLSGGQRQRIALARAFLKDAPILVLDEATSALDSEVEASIQSALARVMQGKTVLAIAHRLSTIAQMDRIIVLDQGRIAEDGTHDELLRRGGLYARYWNRQSGGFIGTDMGTEEAAE
ncbi:MAG: hypothetical protein RLZZ528_473 [Pseudomonadota bacterium]